jgi:hypothetical protein
MTDSEKVESLAAVAGETRSAVVVLATFSKHSSEVAVLVDRASRQDLRADKT